MTTLRCSLFCLNFVFFQRSMTHLYKCLQHSMFGLLGLVLTICGLHAASYVSAAGDPCAGGNSNSLWFFDFSDNYRSDSYNCAIGKPITDIEDSPIEKGAGNPGTELKGSAFTNNWTVLTDTEESWEKTLNYVRGLVNYALWIIGLVALLYLIYHAVLTVTAGTDDGQAQKWREGMKYAAYALIGLGVARFLVSMIIFLINLVTVRYS